MRKDIQSGENVAKCRSAIELLAPARDLQCGLAAVNAGADAVYIGAPRFGARVAAGNSLQEIAALAEYAHRYWARVYVTLNTLLRDDEIDDAVALTWRLYDAHIDGLIVQDPGLLECKLPPLPLIASTQMHNHTPERVAFLEQVGFHRAILARELSLDEIRAIRKAAPSIELECFVHGALCVCYSGQCYLSYALGGRSGNRGECAQPCRKRYELVDGEGHCLDRGHLLSIRDLNLIKHLSELLEAGITSLKIEGRLKDARYVANSVAHYSARLNELGVRRSSSGRSETSFIPDVTKTFNRGFTSYFLHGRKEKIGAHLTPKMTGEPVGYVETLQGNSFVLRPQNPSVDNADSSSGKRPASELHSGDGLCFFDRDGELRGMLVNAVDGRVITPEKMDGLEPGLLVHRNYDREFMAALDRSNPKLELSGAETGDSPRTAVLTSSRTCGTSRRIAVRFKLRPDVLEVTDEDGNTATAAVKGSPEPATKPEAALATIRRQLEKTGDTEFLCAGADVDVPMVPFLPVAAVNALRRDALESLRLVREENRPVAPAWNRGPDVDFPEKMLSYTGNVLNNRAAAFYRRHGVTQIEPAAESGLDMRGHRVMTTRYCLKYELGMCRKNTGPLCLVDEEGDRLELRFDCARCEMHVYLQQTQRKA